MVYVVLEAIKLMVLLPKKTELTVLDVMINNSIGIYASINLDNMNLDVTQKEWPNAVANR